MSVLHIAQKNSIAKQVSNILSQNQKRNIPSKSKYNPIYEFTLQQKNHMFSSVRGHILDMQLPQQCKYWNGYDNKKILSSDIMLIKKFKDDMADVVENIENLAKRNKQLILWLDCDRQGEAIAFQVIEICSRINHRLIIKRARFSAVTPPDIWHAYNNLISPNQLQSDAVTYRIQIDFRTGCSFTRFQTITFKSFYQLQQGSVLSYGTCQMPTLNFVVQRYLQIKNFISEKFWIIQMNCIVDQNILIPFTWNKKNTKKQLQAYQTLYKILSPFPDGNIYANVLSRNKQLKKKYRPLPLTTVKFQKLATDYLKLSSAQAMDIAEKLYQKGFISYPRTETNAFPSSINIKELVSRLNDSAEFGMYVRKLLEDNKYTSPKAGNQNDHAHTPIHPVKIANKQSLTVMQWKVYQLIVRSFLACCSADAIGQQYIVKAEINGEQFKASYLSIKQMNYLQIYTCQKWVQTSFPAHIPDQFKALVDIREGKTTPPGYLTQAQLIGLMEKNQIGTDATIHQHIQTIQKRNYAMKYQNTFKPTNVGAALVQTYLQLGITLPKCQIRRKIQQKMNEIAQGKTTKQLAITQTLSSMLPIYQKIQQLKKQWIDIMKKYILNNQELIKVQLKQRQQNQNHQPNSNRYHYIHASKCLKCRAPCYVRYTKNNKKYFLGCSTYPKCNWTQNLPLYIQDIKQTDKICTKCTIGKIVLIKAGQGQSIQSQSMKNRFNQSDTEYIEICLTPQCDPDLPPTNYQHNSNFNSSSSFAAKTQRTNSYQFPSFNRNQPYTSNTLPKTNNDYSSKSTPFFQQTSNYQPANYHHKNQHNHNKYNNNNKFSSNYTNNYKNNKNKYHNSKQIICFKCGIVGHISTNCQKNNGGGISQNTQSQSKQSKKICKECGVQGRHPKGTNCSTVRRNQSNH